MAPERRSTDVSKITFPIQIVIAIVFSILSTSATIWATQRGNEQAQASMQSDIRNILTRMDNASNLASANQQLSDLKQAAVKESLDDVKRQVQLLQEQYAELSKQISQRK